MINRKKKKKILYDLFVYLDSELKIVLQITVDYLKERSKGYYNSLTIKPSRFVHYDGNITKIVFTVLILGNNCVISEIHNSFGPCIIDFEASMTYEFAYCGKMVSYEELKNIKLKNRIKEK
jgi:hypothetical protein